LVLGRRRSDSTAIAAVVAFFAARIEIRDSLDTMTEDMARQGKWNLRAAFANTIAGALLVVALALSLD